MGLCRRVRVGGARVRTMSGASRRDDPDGPPDPPQAHDGPARAYVFHAPHRGGIAARAVGRGSVSLGAAPAAVPEALRAVGG
ncbi:hypothetical protein FAIPA1_390008 [Frankia sp. AiPs1]